MSRKNAGPKGEVLIPKRFRDALCLKPGDEVALDLRENEIVISKQKIEGNYTDYLIATEAAKLKKTINIEKLIEKEVAQRHGLR